ncbi:MAG: hypothetical protein ACYC61_33815 [Isosphaeraceae bacterium]
MKRIASAIAAIALMGAVLWLGRARTGSVLAPEQVASPGGTSDPDLAGAAERVEKLLADAAGGNIEAYLAAFSGSARARLEQQAGERGRSALADELRRTARARKSHATFEPEPEPDRTGASAGGARITVESTFTDHVERQTFRLVREGSGWSIADVETARDHVSPNIPGATATYQEPEGPPVPRPAGTTASNRDETTQEP